MSNRARGLGYLIDPEDPRDYSSERLLGAPARTDVIIPASMRAFRGPPIEQGRAGSCTAHALTRAIDMGLRYRLAQAKKASVVPPLASRRFLYFNGREQENVDRQAVGQPLKKVTDGGAFPRLIMRGAQKIGWPVEAEFPYFDDPTRINEVPPATAYRAAYDQVALTYYRIAQTGVARVAEVSRALAQGHPVIFGMFVDSAFMSNRGAVIDKIDAADPDGGGHMLTVLEVDHDKITHDNWWGEDWGDGGVGHLSPRLFGSSIVSDVYVLETVPTFSADPAEAS